MNTRLRFVAKTALSAGYFTYNDLFRHYVAHDELRFIMKGSWHEHEDELRGIQTLVDDQFSGKRSKFLQMFHTICRAVGNCSCVGLVPKTGSLIVFVGIFGQYIGMVNVPADTTDFPNEGGFAWGRFICVQDGLAKHVSFESVVGHFRGKRGET